MIVDTHCHLTDKKLSKDVGGVIDRAKRVGVEKIIVPSTDLKNLRMAMEISNIYEGVYCMAGIYPGQAEKSKDWRGDLMKMKELMKKEGKIVGIGEIGLDCYWNRKNLDLDKEVFRAQLKLAVDFDMPVTIHCRQAEAEIKEVFESMDKLPRGQFHCWSGDKEFLEYVLDRRFYVSFCGNVTYKSNVLLRKVLKQVPLNRLLLETDSPYLAPEPMRGKLNEPKNVKITATFMADVLSISIKSLINQTTKNSICLFRFGN